MVTWQVSEVTHALGNSIISAVLTPVHVYLLSEFPVCRRRDTYIPCLLHQPEGTRASKAPCYAYYDSFKLQKSVNSHPLVNRPVGFTMRSVDRSDLHCPVDEPVITADLLFHLSDNELVLERRYFSVVITVFHILDHVTSQVLASAAL